MSLTMLVNKNNSEMTKLKICQVKNQLYIVY